MSEPTAGASAPTQHEFTLKCAVCRSDLSASALHCGLCPVCGSHKVHPTSRAVAAAPAPNLEDFRKRLLQLLELGVRGTDYDRGHKRGIMAAIEALDQWQAGVTW